MNARLSVFNSKNLLQSGQKRSIPNLIRSSNRGSLQEWTPEPVRRFRWRQSPRQPACPRIIERDRFGKRPFQIRTLFKSDFKSVLGETNAFPTAYRTRTRNHTQLHTSKQLFPNGRPISRPHARFRTAHLLPNRKYGSEPHPIPNRTSRPNPLPLPNRTPFPDRVRTCKPHNSSKPYITSQPHTLFRAATGRERTSTATEACGAPACRIATQGCIPGRTTSIP